MDGLSILLRRASQWLGPLFLVASSAAFTQTLFAHEPRATPSKPPQLVLQNGHWDSVTSVAYSPIMPWSALGFPSRQGHGSIISTSSDDGTVRLWDPESGAQFRTIFVSRDAVTAIAFSRQTGTLAAVSADGKLVLIDARSGIIRRELKIDKGAQAVSLGFQDQLVAVGFKGSVTIVDLVNDRKYPLQFPGRFLSFSEDGKYLAAAGSNAIASPCQVVVFDLHIRKIVKDLTDPKTLTVAIRFSKNRLLDWVIPKGGIAYTPEFLKSPCALVSHCNVVRTWDSASDQTTAIDGPQQSPYGATICPDGVTLVQVSPTDPVKFDSELTAWNLSNGTAVYQHVAPSTATQYDSNLACRADQLQFASAGERVQLTDRAHNSFKNIMGNGGSHVSSIWFSPDHAKLYSTALYGVQEWDLLGSSIPQYQILSYPIAFSRDNKVQLYRRSFLSLLVQKTGSADIDTGIPSDGTLAALSVKGDLVAVARADTVAVYSVSPFKLLWSQPITTTIVNLKVLKFVQNDSLLLAITNDATVHTWHASSGEPPSKPFRTRLSGDFLPWAVATNDEGNAIFVAGNRPSIDVWDRVSAKKIFSLPVGRETNRLMATVDGNFLIAGSTDGLITVWDLKRRVRTRTIDTGGGSEIEALALDTRDDVLASGGADGVLRLWRWSSGESLIQLVASAHNDENAWLAVTSEGLFDGDAYGMRDVSWRVGNTNDIVALDSYFTDYFYPDLLAQVLHGRTPHPVVDIATRLQFPSLRILAKCGLAHIELQQKSAKLCIQEDMPTPERDSTQIYLRGNPAGSISESWVLDKTNASCYWSKSIPRSWGSNDLTLSSRDLTCGANVTPTHSVAPPKAARPNGSLFVITAGISNYDATVQYSSGSFGPLLFPSSDADDVENYFRTAHLVENHLFSSIQIYPGLRNENATLSAILWQLKVAAMHAKPDDVLFIFLSGHGSVLAGQEMFYFLPYVPPRDPFSGDVVEFRDAALSASMLTEAIRTIPAKRVVLVVDACYSGGALESLEKVAEAKTRHWNEQRRQWASEDSDAGVYVIAAAMPIDQAAEIKQLKSGILTRALLEKLNESANGQSSSIWEITKGTVDRIPKIAEEEGWTQTALPVTKGVDFPF